MLQEESKNVHIKKEDITQDSKKEDHLSISVSRETREKSAEDKLEELESKMKFVKMIRGANVQREYIICTFL